MSKAHSKRSFLTRPAFICGVALALTTLALAQHALDANLRVGSGGRNISRPAMTMNKSPYYVGRSGAITYNRSVAFGSPEVYSRPTVRHQKSIGAYDPKPLGRTSVNAASLAKSQYSAGRSARATTSRTGVRSVNRTQSSATLQRSGYSPGRALGAMQAPTLNLQQQAYSAGRPVSGTIRSR